MHVQDSPRSSSALDGCQAQALPLPATAEQHLLKTCCPAWVDSVPARAAFTAACRPCTTCNLFHTAAVQSSSGWRHAACTPPEQIGLLLPCCWLACNYILHHLKPPSSACPVEQQLMAASTDPDPQDVAFLRGAELLLEASQASDGVGKDDALLTKAIGKVAPAAHVVSPAYLLHDVGGGHSLLGRAQGRSHR